MLLVFCFPLSREDKNTEYNTGEDFRLKTWDFNLPSSLRQVYDMELLINQIVDQETFIEVKKRICYECYYRVCIN